MVDVPLLGQMRVKLTAKENKESLREKKRDGWLANNYAIRGTLGITSC